MHYNIEKEHPSKNFIFRLSEHPTGAIVITVEPQTGQPIGLPIDVKQIGKEDHRDRVGKNIAITFTIHSDGKYQSKFVGFDLEAMDLPQRVDFSKKMQELFLTQVMILFSKRIKVNKLAEI